MLGRLCGAAAALAIGLVSAEVAAQTCCTTIGANDVGVVGRDHFAAVGVELRHDRGYGSHDPSGAFRTLRDAEVDDVVLSLGAGVRLWPRALQINGALPLRFQYRRLGGSAESHAGVGDGTVALRYLLVEGWRPGAREGRFVPFVEPFVGLRIPTGTGPQEATSQTLVDATGDGATMAYAGVLVVESLSHSDALRLTATYGHRFARRVASPENTRRFAPGPELTARAGFAHKLDLFWAWELFLLLRATGSSYDDGTVVADSRTHRLRTGAVLSHYLQYPSWQLVASASFDPPISGFGSNVPFAGTSISLSLRRNVLE